MSLFPVYLPTNKALDISTGPESGLVVDELERASVPSLQVGNPTDKPILIPAGQQFTGGRQNRKLNVSVVVAPGTIIEVPVSCLEEGRWGRYEEFKHAESFAPRRVRRTSHEQVAFSVEHQDSRRGNQGAVWEAVRDELGRRGVRSDTEAVADGDEFITRDQNLYKVVQELVELGPLPHQVGFVVTHGRRIVSAELFGAPKQLAAHWEALIRSVFGEPVAPNGYPNYRHPLRMLRRFGSVEGKESKGVGMGTEIHIQDRYVVGQALMLEGQLVHACIFAA